MKINTAMPSVGSAPDGGRARTASSTASRPSSDGGDAQVALSPLSSRLQEIGATAAAGPMVDAKRVAEIKQAISEGRFKIDPERIADGLLSSVRQMLAKGN
ncbi:MAG: flagellar biosynthesis anti-sigma factor FlgM [Rhodocyclaceae bacterium]|nr:flagellar biosynthesis anti-sigma factor FlgM [Rhodocyclaceae bacterium]